MTRPFTTLALRACDDALAKPSGIQREAWLRARKQVEAIDAAWERQVGNKSVVELTERQHEFCNLAGVPLRWSDDVVTW